MTDRDVLPRSSPYLRPVPPAARLARSSVLWLLGAGIVVLVLLTVFGESGFGEYLRLRRQRDALQGELADLRAETARLEARLEALRTDPLALEKLARERYNMRREGEEVILLVPDEGQPGSVP